MTAATLPALLSIAPAASAPTAAARPSAGFAKSLDDALSSETGTPEPGAEPTAPEDDAPAAAPVVAEGEPAPTEEAPVAPQVLDAAAWAFALAVAAGPSATAAQATAPTATSPAPVDAVAVVPGAVAPVDPTAVAPAAGAPAAGVPTPLPAAVPGAVEAPAPTTPPTAAQPPAVPSPLPTVPAATPASPAAQAVQTAQAAVLPPGLVVVAAPFAEEPATSATPATGESSAPAVAGPTELPVTAAPAAGSEHAGADTQTGGERPAGAPTALAAPSAPASTAPVAAPVAAAAPAPPPAPVAAQVAPVVAQLAGGPDGSHTMTLVLRPETLGTVEVRVTISQGTVDLTLRHASEAGRAALLDALPDLRRDLESSGLTCSKLDVDRDSGSAWTSSQQQQSAEQRAREAAASGRERSWLRGPEPDGSRPAPVVHSPSSGLDVRV